MNRIVKAIILSSIVLITYVSTSVESKAQRYKQNLKCLETSDDGPILCCNSLVNCCDYGDFEIDGEFVY